jgi:hypothetical protein
MILVAGCARSPLQERNTATFQRQFHQLEAPLQPFSKCRINHSLGCSSIKAKMIPLLVMATKRCLFPTLFQRFGDSRKCGDERVVKARLASQCCSAMDLDLKTTRLLEQRDKLFALHEHTHKKLFSSQKVMVRSTCGLERARLKGYTLRIGEQTVQDRRW